MAEYVNLVVICIFFLTDIKRWTEHNSSSVPDYVMGPYVTNWAPGVRSRPYSTSTYDLCYLDPVWG